MGGTMCKICYLEKKETPADTDLEIEFRVSDACTSALPPLARSRSFSLASFLSAPIIRTTLLLSGALSFFLAYFPSHSTMGGGGGGGSCSLLCSTCVHCPDPPPSPPPPPLFPGCPGRAQKKLRVVIGSREAYGETGVRDTHLEFDSELLGGHVYLAQFETRKMVRFIEMIKDNKIADSTTAVNGTGGGAKKYSKRVKEVLDISMQHCDELQCLISGINFMVQRDADVLYTVDHTSYKIDGLRLKPQGSSFPYLLVNIGSGVSILRINEDGSHERVGGTSLGGSTFFGLCCIVTGCSTFADAMAFAEKGNARNIDLLVEDIYGGDYDEYDLSGDTVASSLGKLVHPEVRAKAASEDVARAILDAITNNIGSLALLHARAHGIQRVIFAGNFLRGNKISIARLAYAMEFWSKVQSFDMIPPRGFPARFRQTPPPSCTSA